MTELDQLDLRYLDSAGSFATASRSVKYKPRLVEEGRGDDSEFASYQRIVKSELAAGGFH